MLRIAFVTCADLGRYFVSKKNVLLTHDDQAACDYLFAQGHEVKALVWGESLEALQELAYDAIIVRSPWDYTDNEQKRHGFLHWLTLLEEARLPLLNPYKVMRWNLDKRYLLGLQAQGVAIPETLVLDDDETALATIKSALGHWSQVVLKPCIGAGAKDTYLLHKNTFDAFAPQFLKIKAKRHFLLQPFLPAIAEEGEWSCLFFNNSYSHAVLKRPRKGHWLVQDELGGTVQSLEPPRLIRDFAEHTFDALLQLLKNQLSITETLLYARIDVMPGPVLGEIELVEPELFFLNRPELKPNKNALRQFHEGIIKSVRTRA